MFHFTVAKGVVVVRRHSDGSRFRSEPLELRVLLSSVPAVTGLTLLNAGTGQPVSGVSLTNGATIDLAQVGRQLDIRPQLAPGDVGSVRFNYDGDPGFRIDNSAPYDITGDSRPRSASAAPAWRPDLGTHELIVTAYSGPVGKGDRGTPMAITFSVIDSSPLPPPVRVNAGGPQYVDQAGDLFTADSGFRGGFERSSATFTPTGTPDPTLYRTWREGQSFEFVRNVPDGVYTVNLYFADPVSTGSGMREFDVWANGQSLLNHYDLVADAGPDAAVVKSFQVTSKNGGITLAFRGGVGNAIVSAVEVIGSRAPADPAPVYANAGGLTYTDSLNRHFDTLGFSGGATATATAAPANTADAPLLDNYRTGSSFTFTRAVAPGNYELWLDFLEPTYTQAGQRVFDVVANGQSLLDHYDIVQDAGADQPDVKAFAIHVGNQPLTLSFHGDVGDAIVSSIVLVPTDVPAAALLYSINGAPDPVKRQQDRLDLRVLGEAIEMWANSNRGKLPNSLSDLVAGYLPQLNELADPRSATNPPRGEMSRLEGLAWAHTLNDYVYVGAGRRDNQLTASTILAYENPDRVTGDIDVLYGDAHVGTLTRAQLAQRLGTPVGNPTQAPPAGGTAMNAAPDPQVLASAANLSAIGQAMVQYAQTQTRNGDPFPADLATLVSTSSTLTASTFINPREPNPTTPPTLTRAQLAEWVAAHSDYVYVAAHKRLSSSPNALLAYENPAGMKGGLLMLFADGRVEFREMRWALETIARDQSMPNPPL